MRVFTIFLKRGFMKRKNKILLIVLAAVLSVLLIGGAVYLFAFYLPEKKETAEHERLVKEYRESKLEKYREENEKYADYEVDVAFIGDSLTDGYDLEKYYPEFVVSNRGIGGDTTFDVEGRIQTSLYDLKPKVAVMLIGGNNLKTMFENYENILLGMKENLPETKIILVSLTAMGQEWGAEKNEIAALNNVKIKILAEKYGFEYVDLFTPLYDISIGEIYAEYTSDGAHQTDKGYEVFTATIKPAIEKALEEWKSENQ